jgi:hypothetical protein
MLYSLSACETISNAPNPPRREVAGRRARPIFDGERGQRGEGIGELDEDFNFVT